MDEPTVPAAPANRRRWGKRAGFAAVGTAAAVACVVALVYGGGVVGNNGAAVCPAAAAATARLDPLARGEVAAFGVSQPARIAPDLAFDGPDGKPTTLAAFKGRTVLVNLWATWCVPCRTEMPALDKLQEKLGGTDFQVVAINVDTARLDKPRAFLRDNGITTLSFYADPSADVLQRLKAGGQLLGLPTTLLVDRDGCELGRMAGPADWASPDAQALIQAARS